MTVKFTPASIVIEVPTDAVMIPAATLLDLLQGRRPPETTALYALLAPRTVTITEGTRVRLKVHPEDHPDFKFSMWGWDNDDVEVVYLDAGEVRIHSELSQDYSIYTGPFEKILNVLEVLEDKSCKRVL